MKKLAKRVARRSNPDLSAKEHIVAFFRDQKRKTNDNNDREMLNEIQRDITELMPGEHESQWWHLEFISEYSARKIHYYELLRKFINKLKK